MQATLSDYAFNEGPNDEVLYHDGENSVNREEMRTLGSDEEVDNAVINAWAHILNTKGKKHSIYFSTMPYLIVCTDKGKSVNTTKEVRHEKFAKRLNYEMTNSGITNIKKYREFLFPVPAFKHFYLLCINMYNGTVDLIDNRKLPMNVKASTKYEDNPQKMVKY
uniref:Ubiquitin-like protease family profile domain-containing protein n=1 Tax=Chenopodium quinoa TaxID=63459 RepID=A0A803MBQ2_CHEQI